jgi:RHS repeat-associated protein
LKRLTTVPVPSSSAACSPPLASPLYASRTNVPAFMIRDGVTYRILADHLGSPRLVIDAATGAVAQTLGYDEMGNVLSDNTPGFQPFGFAGGLYDADTELVRFGTRDYDPSTGRWTAKDPSLFAGGTTNLYEYSFNDPTNFIDPEGQLPKRIDKLYGLPKKFGSGTTRSIQFDPDLLRQFAQLGVKLEISGYPASDD